MQSCICKNGEAVINNAEKFADHCKETLTKGNRINDKCNHKRRTIIYIRKEDINHNRAVANAAVLSVPGPIVCSFNYYTQIFQGITPIHKCSLAFVLSSTSIKSMCIMYQVAIWYLIKILEDKASYVDSRLCRKFHLFQPE
jgi:hypothetical protein